jgi:hypothetical protein
MTKETLHSLESSPSPETGATDSPWQPSFWHWLISALSGTVEIEKQTAWLKQNNADLRKRNEDLRKHNEERRVSEEKQIEELRLKNKQLAEIELKMREISHS